MITKKLHAWKSSFSLAFAMVASLLLFSTCMSVDQDLAESKLSFTYEGGIAFGKDGGSTTIELTSNKDWKVTKGVDAKWIEVSSMSGQAGTSVLTVNVKSNEGMARQGVFTIIASSTEKTITVSQDGKDGSRIEYTTIKEIRTIYADKGVEEWTIAQPLKLNGFVISDRVGGNRPSKRDGFIQDKAGNGLAFRVSQSDHLYDMGDELIIDLEGATLLYYGGILQLNFSNKNANVASQNVAITPKELTIEEILNGEYDGTLVKIKDVQFEDYHDLSYWDKGLATNRILENDNGANINVKTTKYANFKEDALPEGNGDIVGIVSLYNDTWQLTIRNLDDVKEMSKDKSTRFKTEEPPTSESEGIAVDKNNIVFDEKGGDETVNITAEVDWKAKSNKSWLRITPDKGFNTGAITATADENEGEAREATITITVGAITKTVQVTQKSVKVSSNVATDLFFSEYIKGTSYNKYLEIYNGTGNPMDLSDYIVEVYINGQATPKYTELLSGTLENGEVVVLQHSKAAIYYGEAIESNAINFNGNDAIALVKISTEGYVDIIGCIGHDPGSKGWIDSYDKELSTFDKTLVRKLSVRSGVTKNPSKGFPTLGAEWIAYPMDTADYLGSHTME